MTNFKNEILNAHNEYRKRHGSAPLKWSSKLESNAQKWANELAKKGYIQHASQSEEGENLACMRGADLTGQKASDMWYEEIKDYNFNNPGFSSKTGHFTQVVWAGSSELGVGKATAANGMQFVVARYFPAGNVLRQFQDNVKPSGSKYTTSVPSPRSDKPTTSNAGRPTTNNNETRITITTNSRTTTTRTSGAGNAGGTKDDEKSGRQSDKDFQRTVVRTHNMYRKRHGAKPLQWSSKLLKAAQEAAEEAARTNTLRSVDMTNVGQNMAAMTGGELPGQRVSEMWYEEESKYNYNSPGFSTTTGSFTQLVWSGTAEFAVGRAFSKGGGTFVVALYQPPGNVRGQYEENVFRPTGPVPTDSNKSQGCKCTIL